MKKNITDLCVKATKRFGPRTPKVITSVFIKALKVFKIPASFGGSAGAFYFVLQSFLEHHLYKKITEIYNSTMENIEIEPEIQKAVSETIDKILPEEEIFDKIETGGGINLLGIGWILKTVIVRPLNGIFQTFKNIPINFYNDLTFSNSENIYQKMETAFNEPESISIKKTIRKFILNKLIKEIVPLTISLLGAIIVIFFGWWFFSQFIQTLINFFKIIYSIFPKKDSKVIKGETSKVIDVDAKDMKEIDVDLQDTEIKNKLESYLNKD